MAIAAETYSSWKYKVWMKKSMTRWLDGSISMVTAGFAKARVEVKEA